MAAVDVPPPPRGLVEGRRRLAAEAAALRPRQGTPQRLPLFAIYRMRLVPVLASLLLVLALLPFFTQEVAASLPGSPLYGLKILAQDVHLWLTSSPDAQADLGVSVAEKRLNDVATALEQGQHVGETAAESAEKQLFEAVQTMAQHPETAGTTAPLQLMTAIQNCERVMVRALNQMSESDQRPLRELLRQMQRARAELQPGAGEAMSEGERARQGDPPGPEEIPFGLQGADPGWQWPESPGQGAGEPAAGEPGQPAQGSNQPQDPGGAAQGAEVTPPEGQGQDPPSTPVEPQQNGQQQGTGNSDPGGNSSPDNGGNNGHSGHP